MPEPISFVCPSCKGPLVSLPSGFFCAACERAYPIVCGIPDFRLAPDPYIGMAEDRAKGELLFEAGKHRSFEELLRYYYSITKEDPPDLAIHWAAHAMAEVSIADFILSEARFPSVPGALLDLGCSTGGLLIAARDRAGALVGVDVAFRWLAIGRIRLREAGVEATLVCANAEALPFRSATFAAVTATDLIEHLQDAPQAVAESFRVVIPGAKSLWTTNNRYAPLPDPHVRLWGIGYLPRRWQAAYVARRRTDLHRYRISMRSRRELDRTFRAAGFQRVRSEAAPLFAPHRPNGPLQRLLRVYNRIRGVPLIGALSRLVGPRLWTLADR
jgi:ubiquinone/menaquinone biosynthesis C-methylase UbiE/uncharacterized protein YbaR (Trm112 family)